MESTVINKMEFSEITGTHPRKACFNSVHKSALFEMTSDIFRARFAVPNIESLYKLFKAETGLDLYPKYNNYWRGIPIGNDVEYEKIEQFVTKYKNIVFLRDLLDLSIALGENFNEDDSRTELGEMEKKAKWDRNNEALSYIVDYMSESVASFPYYQDSAIICAVPPSSTGSYQLPRLIASGIVNEIENIEDISDRVYWVNDKPNLKGLKLSEKWDKLVESNLKVDFDFDGRDVILIDDLYQSGTTMNFIGMKLKEKGAGHVYGLTVVKSRTNDNN